MLQYRGQVFGGHLATYEPADLILEDGGRFLGARWAANRDLKDLLSEMAPSLPNC
jgi:hypothetical protein